MSRTTKNRPFSVFRHPKGYKQAIINKVRTKTIPPNSYDDIKPDRLAELSAKHGKSKLFNYKQAV